MSELRRFIYYPMQKPARIQPECPVYIYAYSLAVQNRTGAAFVQLRLVNRSDRVVHSVFLKISGMDSQSRCLYELHYMPLAGCGGVPHKDFGEDHLLFLPEGNVRSLELEVEDVLFEDGLIWRKQNCHELLTPEQAGWKSCSCGMKNPAEAENCAFCGKQLMEQPAAAEEAKPDFSCEDVKPPIDTNGFEPVPFEPEPMPLEPEPVSLEPEPVSLEPEPMPLEPEPSLAAAQTHDPQPAVLAQLLASLRARMDRTRKSAPAKQEPELELEQESKIAVEQEPRQSPDEENAVGETESSLMQETSLLIQEMQRRLLALEAQPDGHGAGEAVHSAEPLSQDTARTEEEDLGSRGILFWVFMVILMIVLALVGFFGVLYWKGYFG